MFLVTEAIPDILTDRQMRLLTLGLRAKVKDTEVLCIIHFSADMSLKSNICIMSTYFSLLDICLIVELLFL